MGVTVDARSSVLWNFSASSIALSLLFCTILLILFLLLLLPRFHPPSTHKPAHSPPLIDSLLDGINPDLGTEDLNLDWGPARRRLFAAFQKHRFNLEHILFRGNDPDIKADEKYVVNSRGVELFTKIWLPGVGKPKALICLCHGYGDTITFYLEGIARKLASAQYAVVGLDYEGFGLSSGLHGYISNFDSIVDDVIEYYSAVKEQPEYKGVACFLFGQSMGGAVALKAHLKQQNAWTGAILVAPMCKIADEMYPPWPVLDVLKLLASLCPTWKIVPGKDVAALAFRDIEKRKQTAFNVIGYGDRPRLKTALELIRATDDVGANLNKVSLPLLILHGAADRVTDPSISKALYDYACSRDKTLHLYEDAWHSILEGESDEIINKVLGDILSWLDAHSITEPTTV